MGVQKTLHSYFWTTVFLVHCCRSATRSFLTVTVSMELFGIPKVEFSHLNSICALHGNEFSGVEAVVCI